MDYVKTTETYQQPPPYGQPQYAPVQPGYAQPQAYPQPAQPTYVQPQPVQPQYVPQTVMAQVVYPQGVAWRSAPSYNARIQGQQGPTAGSQMSGSLVQGDVQYLQVGSMFLPLTMPNGTMLAQLVQGGAGPQYQQAMNNDLRNVQNSYCPQKEVHIHHHGGGGSGGGPHSDRELKCYLARYKDLRNAFGTSTHKAKEHWHNHGRNENRRYCDPDDQEIRQYLRNYHDLRKAFGSHNVSGARNHFFNHGLKENRNFFPM